MNGCMHWQRRFLDFFVVANDLNCKRPKSQPCQPRSVVPQKNTKYAHKKSKFYIEYLKSVDASKFWHIFVFGSSRNCLGGEGGALCGRILIKCRIPENPFRLAPSIQIEQLYVQSGPHVTKQRKMCCNSGSWQIQSSFKGWSDFSLR